MLGYSRVPYAAAVDGNFFARTLVNEPLSFLTADQLGAEIKKAGIVMATDKL